MVKKTAAVAALQSVRQWTGSLQPLAFSLKPISLDGWQDDDGEPLTSVYLEAGGNAETTGVKRKLSARDDAILTSLREAIGEHGVTPQRT